MMIVPIDFQDILEITNKKTIYKKNLECLEKEFYKFLSVLPPPIMYHIFEVRDNINNIRNFQSLYSTYKKTVNCGTEELCAEVLRSGT